MAKRGRKRKKKPLITGKTFFNLIGLFLLIIGIMMLASFSQIFSSRGSDGQVLQQINAQLFELFGGLSIFVPFIIMLIAGHFFNSDKLKFIKLHITFGSCILLISMIGIFRSGTWGKTIYDNFALDFTPLGAVAILIVGFLVGLILFLDTTIDVLLLSVWKLLEPFAKVFQFKGKGKKKDTKIQQNEVSKPAKDNFIRDNRVDNKPVPINLQTITPAKASSQDLTIKPSVKSDAGTWVYPPTTLLREVKQKEADRGDVKGNAQTIETTLDSFGIRARVAEVNFGPTVTQYAIEITRGTKLSKITALANDLALALAAPNGLVRIEAPIPGRSLVGIEIPNKKPEIVTLKNLIESKVLSGNDPLLVPLGLDVAGMPRSASIADMPHILIAGTTGSGKSVMLNAWITTLMMRTRPDEVRMILVDPKQVEMVQYNGTPHLLTDVITDPSKVVSALRWSVAEMEVRYKDLAQAGVRNLASYNNLTTVEKKPYIIFFIDELADLMMYAANDVEDMITRIAQKARAVGIHLVLTTQRPSVDVITGLMKANIPGRIAFNVSSMVDSRVIIDMPGAEKLLGRGDMFYLPPDQAKPRRIQGPFITEAEVHDVVGFLKSQAPVVHYTEEITEQPIQTGGMIDGVPGMSGGAADRDPLFSQAVQIIMQSDKASASLLQRKLRVGYARAARILDELFEAGYVGPSEGSKPREVLKRVVNEQAV
ncbi:type IV secretion system DNA-binding domain-containing protein [Candidatus Woesebacteria bacterium]|nr:type IV secretion system DNA-binding domain-containing protein [Candidatus Woesebacteria bacterium]